MATATKEATKADIHHIIRVIGQNPMPDGTITGDMADAVIRNWFEAGYELFNTHYAGDTPHGVRIVYILIKRDSA